ncbi:MULTISPECIES: GntR family transcriptional regulator [Pandoraea]|jgi:DNA-binding GntR family transcriptional regulator|uniref:Carbon starvation induced regulator n=1 Tax=Pandoraea pnomenusa TaxID=93220 RepID=A0A378YCS2_9BURK|nr:MULTISPECIES: GntR family transcriptional regulator [Pandoraea]AHB05850.1 GntR family transcriptional regulator [Pandoraea pnomenusa 3kgm]AHB78079.1 GntR family transcriptional regulator [Pandoraea pnomenusa]AHN73626.1 GntR family transcriptional regulator [Pandoraea pnomenusa]AIU25612.1 GntR family transcriptional regulator [Pandoraea pnomenusa]ANC46745.1 GntR family transcriptional regulator [Pandoraea pnomenusa]
MAETIAARICRVLTGEIIDGRLPPGQKLEEVALAERFKASRTPIREALRELNARGLIELTPHKGGVVASISVDDLSDMLEAMCELDALCCRLSAQRMSAMQKKQLEMIHIQSKQCMDAGDEAGYLALNREFHQLLSAGTQNKTLMALIDSHRERLAPFRAAQSDVEERFTVSFDEHERVVQAVLASDAEGAYNAMRSHTARLSIHVLERLQHSRKPT